MTSSLPRTGGVSTGPGTGHVVLVVGEPTDVGARVVARAVAAARPDLDVRWWSAATFGRAHWSHRVGADGATSTTVSVGGSAVPDADVALVWFRASVGVPAGLRAASEADQQYALCELHALVVSWLAGLGDRVVNAVDGDGSSGPSWSSAVWRGRARRLGLPVADRVEATSARLVDGWRGHPWDTRRPWRPERDVARRVLVAGTSVVGADDADADRYRRLAAEAGCRVLTVLLDADGCVVGVDPCAPLDDTTEVLAAVALLAEVA